MTSCAKSSKTSCSLVNFYRWPTQRTLTLGVRITVQLVFSLARLDWTERENILLFAFSEAVESKLGKTGDQLYSETSTNSEWVLYGQSHNCAILSKFGTIIISYDQCDQIGRFVKILCIKVSFKSNPIVWCLFGLFENISFQVEPAVAALENLGLLLILTSRSHWLLL